MGTLEEGHRMFEAAATADDRRRYRELADRHRPAAVLIGCSDARVVPEVITCARPGELFVIRTAGNIVPPPGSVDAVAASIEYAVEVLDVREVVVCGHSGCGAMTSLALGHDLSALPAVSGWLATAGHDPDELAGGSDEEIVAAAVRANVRRQVETLAAYPSVRTRLRSGELTLAGWVHDIGSGALEVVRPTVAR